MKQYLSVLLIFFLSITANTQNLDSLWNVWKDNTQADTMRLKAIHTIAWDGYLFSQPDSAFYFAKKQYGYASLVNNKKWMADALNTQAVSLYVQSNYKKALKYCKKSLNISKEIGDKNGIASSFNNIGNIYNSQSKYEQALIYSIKSLIIKKEIGNQQEIAKSLGNIGNVYYEQGNYEDAVLNYQNSLNISKEIGDKNGIAASLNNIGIIYYEQSNFQEALNYYKNSLNILNETIDKKRIAACLGNIGYIYYEQGNCEEAFVYFKKSLKIKKELGDKKGIAASLGNIGDNYGKQGNNEEALNYYKKSLKIYEEIGDKYGIAMSLCNIGGTYKDQSSLKRASIKVNEGLQIAKEIGALDQVDLASKSLYEIYKELGDDYNALKMHEQHIVAKDSLAKMNAEENLYKIKIEKEYQLAKTKKQIQHKADLEREANKRYILIAGIGFLLLLGGLGLWAFFQKKKDNRIIKANKAEVDLAYEKLEEKNNDILDSINYAKRIQSALLPTDKTVKKSLKESFILYLPKDIVAGDFYWLEKKEDTTLFAVADCTGHGVPGAMVSVICNNGLNRSVREHQIIKPSKILDKTREVVVKEFAKSSEDILDGMDIALCSIKGNKLNYAGANNPLIVIRNKEVIEVKADRQPIGAYMKTHDFTNHSLEIQKDDMIYLFTDGYADQFGGEKNKKYRLKNQIKLLSKISIKPIDEQERILKEEFVSWKGSEDQLDDVCVMGIRV